MEIGVSNAAGGIHTLFEAVDDGSDAVRNLMNENFRNANQYFDIDYDSWQMTRQIDFIIRQHGNTPNGQRATQEFMRLGGHQTPAAARQALALLQTNINMALNPNLYPDVRRNAALAVNRDVAILASIGRSLENVRQTVSTNDDRLPVVDLNNLEFGIIGKTGHFAEFERPRD